MHDVLKVISTQHNPAPCCNCQALHSHPADIKATKGPRRTRHPAEPLRMNVDGVPEDEEFKRYQSGLLGSANMSSRDRPLMPGNGIKPRISKSTVRKARVLWYVPIAEP